MLFTWILAACLPLALIATSDYDCCPKKVQSASTYILEKQLDPMDPMYSPNCMRDGCVYIMEGTDMRYCFASGGSDVQCVTERNETYAPTNPPMTYNSTMTYAPTMAPTTNMATNSTMTYAPTTTVQASTCVLSES